MRKQNLGEMLLAANLIDEVQMQIALAEQKQTGKKFGSTLVELKFIDEDVLAAFLSKQIDIPCISLMHIDINRKVLRKVPGWLARDCHAIPIRMEGTRIEVAMVDPTDVDLIRLLETTTAMTVTPLIAPQSSIEKMIHKVYRADELDEDTLSVKPVRGALDPIFADLIDEIESGDFDERLTRIEENLDRIWTLLEKILRTMEKHQPTETQ